MIKKYLSILSNANTTRTGLSSMIKIHISNGIDNRVNNAINLKAENSKISYYNKKLEQSVKISQIFYNDSFKQYVAESDGILSQRTFEKLSITDQLNIIGEWIYEVFGSEEARKFYEENAREYTRDYSRDNSNKLSRYLIGSKKRYKAKIKDVLESEMKGLGLL